MQAFAELIQNLSKTTSLITKRERLVHYFQQAPPADVCWVIALFTGRRPRRLVNTALLRQSCLTITGYPAWLFEETYQTVGDLAETIALLLPLPDRAEQPAPTYTLAQMISQLEALRTASDTEKVAFVLEQWAARSRAENLVFNKLLTGGFRIGVSQLTLVQALGQWTNLPAPVVAHRISGSWHPATTPLSNLLQAQAAAHDPSQPYPFYLAHAVEDDVAALGEVSDWQAEWKWDGIRGQIIVRANQRFVWSRGEELLTSKFPEFDQLEKTWPAGTVVDGEILCLAPSNHEHFQVRPFQLLQTRIGRKHVSRRQLQEAAVGFIAYDLLEWEGQDWRDKPLHERRARLMMLVQQHPHQAVWLSPILAATQWQDLIDLRQQARELGSEGLMLKHRNSAYGTGRKKGDWWKWKVDPWHIDAVLVYAQKGHGRRSNLFTDYTFALRDGDQLVPFTKAYSGLTDKEFIEVDAFIKQHVLEKFGPVRTVTPHLVFEIAFEGLARSNRHKSGVSLRFPRMARWRRDKQVADINTLDDLKAMLRLAEQQQLTTNDHL